MARAIDEANRRDQRDSHGGARRPSAAAVSMRGVAWRAYM